MFVNKSGLKKSFAVSMIFLYALGLCVACAHQSKGEYLRYLDNEIALRNAVLVEQNDVIYQGCSLNSDYTTVNYNNNTCVPVIHYWIRYNALTGYPYGEFHFELYLESDVINSTDAVYNDYESNLSNYGRFFNDINNFTYNSVSYDLQSFFVAKNNEGTSYDYVQNYKEFGFWASMDYNEQFDILELECDLQFKTPLQQSATSITLRYLDLDVDLNVDSDFSVQYDDISYDNYTLAQNLNFAMQNTSSYQLGVNAVLTNPHDYGLYTYDEYLRYGQARYNAGVNDSASSDVLSMAGVMETIFASPVTMFKTIFNSSAFTWTMPNGNILDLGGLMTFLLTIGIALAVVRLIMKIGGK